MVLVFDVAAELAMFRKSYTTTSQVSYPFPPPTAIAGLLAAVTGIGHDAGNGCKNAAYWREMAGTRVALGLRNPVRWLSTTVNLIKYKNPNGNMGEHIQSKHQLVKKPHYRIYVSGGGMYAEIKRRLEKREFIFTPYLGVAYALADIKYLGEFDEEEIADQESFVNTVIPLYEGVQPDIKKCGAVHREIVPFRLDEHRQLKDTVTVIYPEIVDREADSGPLWLKARGKLVISQVGGERVAWFERW